MTEEQKKAHVRMPCGGTWPEAFKHLAALHETVCKEGGSEPLRVVVEWAPGVEGFAVTWEFRDGRRTRRTTRPASNAVARQVAEILAKGLQKAAQ